VEYNNDGTVKGYNYTNYSYDSDGRAMLNYYQYDYVKQADGSYKYVLMGQYTRAYDGTVKVSMWDGKANPGLIGGVPISGYYYDPKGGSLIAKYGKLPPGIGGSN